MMDVFKVLASPQVPIKEKCKELKKAFNLVPRINFPVPEYICITPDKENIVSGHQDGSLRLWSLSDHSYNRLIGAHDNRIICIAFTDTKFMISAGVDCKTKIWDYKQGSCILESDLKVVACIAVEPGDDIFYIGSLDNEINKFSISKKKIIESWKAHENSVMCMALSADQHFLMSGSEDHTVKIWDLHGHCEVNCLSQHYGPVSSLCLRENFIITGSWDKHIHITEVNALTLTGRLSGHLGDINSILSIDQYLVSASSDKTIKIWDFSSQALVHTFNLGALVRNIIEVNGRIASTSINKNIRIFNIQEKKSEEIVTGHFFAIYTIDVSPDHRLLITGSKDKTVRIWDLSSKKQVKLLIGHTDSVKIAKISPNNRYAVSISDDGDLRIWDLDSEEVVVIKIGKVMKNKDVNVLEVTEDKVNVVLNDFSYQVFDLLTGKKLNSYRRQHKVLLFFSRKIKLR